MWLKFSNALVTRYVLPHHQNVLHSDCRNSSVKRPGAYLSQRLFQGGLIVGGLNREGAYLKLGFIEALNFIYL